MRQRTARRCYLRRLLGCFRHSGRSQRPEYRRAFRKTLRLHAVLRIALIHTRQRTALRCYLRRLAPSVRPPQPPKIDFVDNSRASAKCSSENRAGRSLGARRPEYRCAFHKTGVTPARGSPPPHRGGLLLAKGSRSPPPSANIWLTRVNYILYKCGSENRAGRSLGAQRPAIRTAHSRGLRRLRPEICAENLKKSPENTKIAKKACKLLYDSIICTTFGTSDPSEKT